MKLFSLFHKLMYAKLILPVDWMPNYKKNLLTISFSGNGKAYWQLSYFSPRNQCVLCVYLCWAVSSEKSCTFLYHLCISLSLPMSMLTMCISVNCVLMWLRKSRTLCVTVVAVVPYLPMAVSDPEKNQIHNRQTGPFLINHQPSQIRWFIFQNSMQAEIIKINFWTIWMKTSQGSSCKLFSENTLNIHASQNDTFCEQKNTYTTVPTGQRFTTSQFCINLYISKQ